jgi:hypothetical protein
VNKSNDKVGDLARDREYFRGRAVKKATFYEGQAS